MASDENIKKNLLWYVMRDLKRPNAKEKAYQTLDGKVPALFTPMQKVVLKDKGQLTETERPFINDLLFVYDTRDHLDTLVGEMPLLQYRWLRHHYMVPMTVDDAEMRCFITATTCLEQPLFYHPGQITDAMIGRKVRLLEGPLRNYEFNLLQLRGSKKKRVILSLEGFVTATVEVEPQYIQLL